MSSQSTLRERLAATLCCAAIGAGIGALVGLRNGEVAGSAIVGAIIGAVISVIDIIYVSCLLLVMVGGPIIMIVAGAVVWLREHWVGAKPILLVIWAAGAIVGGLFAATESRKFLETLLGALAGLALSVVASLFLIGLVAGLGYLLSNGGSRGPSIPTGPPGPPPLPSFPSR